jgi:tetratricopeptide (TPR) repeat protein
MQEALDALERALSLNPLDITVRVAATHGWGMAGDYQAAQEHYQLGVKIDATAPLLYPAMGLIHQREGHLDRAAATFQTACLVSARSPIAVAALGNVLAEAGDLAKAEALLQEIVSAPKSSPLALAILHLGLGNIDESMNCLAEAIEARESYIIMIPLDPRFRKVHGHPRFRQLLGQMHLTAR